jgi:hypothetical protein
MTRHPLSNEAFPFGQDPDVWADLTPTGRDERIKTGICCWTGKDDAGNTRYCQMVPGHSGPHRDCVGYEWTAASPPPRAGRRYRILRSGTREFVADVEAINPTSAVIAKETEMGLEPCSLFYEVAP